MSTDESWPSASASANSSTPNSSYAASDRSSTPLTLLQRSKKDHSKSEWETIRPHFTKLYIDEKLPLAEVSAILKEEHHFLATDKQYKDRVKKWGMRKNFKAQEKKEAIAAGATSVDSAVVAHNGMQMPAKRLRRYAKDEKLQFVQAAILQHSSSRINATPQVPPSDIIIELPRYMVEKRSSPRTVHSALETLDRLSKQRYPILDFSLLGVSETVVRYGLSYNRRSQSRVVTRALHGDQRTLREDGKYPQLELEFFAAWDVMKSSLATLADQKLAALLSMICRRLYYLCFEKFDTGLVGYDHSDPNRDPTVALRPIRCLAFKSTAAKAMSLCMQLIAHGAIAGMARTIFEGISHLEFAKEFMGYHNPRLVESGFGSCPESSSVQDSLGISVSVALQVKRPGKIINGLVQIPCSPDCKTPPEDDAATKAPEAVEKLVKPEERPLVMGCVPPPDVYLMDAEDATGSIDPEFQDAARRAAKVAGSVPALQPLSSPSLRPRSHGDG